MSSVASLAATGTVSGGVSIAGLGNGTDFSEMIDQLKKIEMIPTQRMLKWKSEWQSRQEAFKMVREQLVALRDASLKISTMDKFLVKNATSSDSKVATGKAGSAAIQNSYRLDVDQVATTSIWSIDHTFASDKSIINNTSTNQKFSYEYAGSVRTITVPPNTTLESFKNLINNDGGNPGVRASLIKSSNGYTFQIKGMDQGTENQLKILNSDGLTEFPSASDYGVHKAKYQTELADGSKAILDPVGKKMDYIFSYKGSKYTVEVQPGETLDQFAQKINDLGCGVTASVVANGSFCDLVLEGDTPGEAIEAPKQPKFEGFSKPLTSFDTAEPTAWHVQNAKNAKIKVDGWPSGAGEWLEVSSNTISDVVEGLTFTISGEGTTTITVANDTEAIVENVEGFLEAVNTFRKTINELTKYDANKSTVSLEYADNQFEMQKGSILTGNYGIQMISSRLKQATAGAAIGFMPRTQVDDVWRGDIFTSLSQMGIKTNAEGEGSEMFGLLVLNTDEALPTLEKALAENAEAVAEFFSAVNKGVSDSPHFSFASSMQNITKAGSYQVSYDVDASGNVTNAYINGKEAKWYPDTGQIGLARIPPQSDNNSKATAVSDGTLDFKAEIEVLETAQKAEMLVTTTLTDPATPFVETTGGQFTYEYNGKSYSVDVDPDEANTLGHIAGKITWATDNPGVVASVVKQDDGTYALKLQSKEDGTGNRENGQPNAFTASGTSLSFGHSALGTVTETDARDAKYTINGGSVQTSKSNTITNNKDYPGVTFTLKGKTEGTPVTITGQKHNNADGIVLQIDNLAPGSYTGQTRIKQGKVNELLTLLNGEPNKPEEGILGSKGTLQVLMDNYKNIMENIDKKIEKEQVRLTKWERTQRLRFSRLDALLKQYDSLSGTIESQIKQLPGNKASS